MSAGYTCRAWTYPDQEFVRRHYRQQPTSWIAARLGRNPSEIYGVAHRLHLTHDLRSTVAIRATAHRLWNAGLTCTEIAGETGYHRQSVASWLRARGCDVLGRSRRVRPWLTCAGSIRAAACGWPGAPTARSCAVLDLLEARGPMRCRDLGTALGINRTQVNRYLARLREAGLVEQTRPGSSRTLWCLAPGVRKGGASMPVREASNGRG
jgi:DNA-binding transcriptional ArsR family regulator